MNQNTRTTVVNVRRDEFDYYIGRAMPGRAASPFANPFRIGPDGSREQVIERYRGWLTGQPELLARLPELKGKRLGCWCKPAACHGDVLVELLEGAPPEAPEPQGALF